jgi:hypothetical protein
MRYIETALDPAHCRPHFRVERFEAGLARNARTGSSQPANLEFLWGMTEHREAFLEKVA